MIRVAVITCAIAASAWCTAAEVFPEFPRTWGEQAPDRVDGTACPRVAGQYVSEGAERVVKVERGSVDEQALARLPASARLLFNRQAPVPAHKRNSKPLDTRPTEHSFMIAQPDGQSIRVVRESADRKVVFTDSFSSSDGDFYCEGGFVALAPVSFAVGLGNTARTQRFTRATDGALLYYERVESQSRDMFLTTALVTHYWYRFRPSP